MTYNNLFVREIPVARILVDIERHGAAVVSKFLTTTARLNLCAEAGNGLNFADQPVRHGNNVEQRFRMCDTFPSGSFFSTVSRELGVYLTREFGRCLPTPLPRPIVFNDHRVQDYTMRGVGIGWHRDQSEYSTLIVILPLFAKSGRFRVAREKTGRGAVTLPHDSGDIIFLRGMHFHGSPDKDKRPYHCVDQIEEPFDRMTFSLRQSTARPT